MIQRPTGTIVKLDEQVEKWIALCKIEKDAHVCISGDEGDGKSHLMIQIIKKFKVKDLWNAIVFTPNIQEFYDKYAEMEINSVLGLDEALDLINRLDWNKIDTRDLVKHVRGRVRKEKAGVFLYNAQLFRDLHTYWRAHRLRYWLELTPREQMVKGNRVFVMEKGRVPFLTGKRDSWLLSEEETKWLKSLTGGPIFGVKYMELLRRHPFYTGEFTFDKLDDRLGEEYKKRRQEAFEEYRIEPDMNIRVKQVLEQRNDMIREFMDKGGDKKNVTASTGLTERHINRILKSDTGHRT